MWLSVGVGGPAVKRDLVLVRTEAEGRWSTGELELGERDRFPVTSHSGGDTYIQLQTGTVADVEAVIHLVGVLTPQASWFVL